MADESTNESTRKRNFSWNKCYSSIKSRPAVEQRIGVTIDELHETALTVKEMITLAGHDLPKEGEDPLGRVIKYIRPF